MIVITVRYERADKESRKAFTLPSSVSVLLENAQTGSDGSVVLREGESVEHRLRVEMLGVLEFSVRGGAEALP